MLVLNLRRCLPLITLPGRCAALRLETRVTSDASEIQIDEAEGGAEVLPCHRLPSSRDLLCEEVKLPHL